MVLLSSRNLQLSGPQKLAQPFIGPFKITQVLSPLTYRLELPSHLRIHDTFHVELLKPYNSPLPGQPSSTPAPPILIDGEPEYEVEALLDCRGTTQARRQFLVSWKGYPAYENVLAIKGRASTALQRPCQRVRAAAQFALTVFMAACLPAALQPAA